MKTVTLPTRKRGSAKAWMRERGVPGNVSHGLGKVNPSHHFEKLHREGARELKDQTVTVVQGDLTAARVDVIVNAANEYLRHGGGLAAALAAAGGEEFVADSDRWVSEHGPVRRGEAAVTVGGRLQAAWVVHVVGPRYREGQDNPAMLRQAVRAALDASARVDAETVAMPAISTGVFGYPLEAATVVIASECVRWAREHPGVLREIQLVGYDRRTADALRRGLDRATAEGAAGGGESG